MADIWMDVDAALSEVPINLMPLIDDTDFKTREESVTYDQAGLDLVWNFVTTAGAFSQTAVTPTDTAGDYDWVNQGNGMYSIEIPASSGASINNDTEGFGWFTGFATGILPWRGPVIGFRAAGLNNALVDSAYSATRGLAGTALPDAAADAAGGLVISDAGALDIDALNANVTAILDDTDLIDDGTSGLAKIATDVAAILTDTGTTLPSTLATIAGYLDTEIAAILADTAEIGAAGAGLSAVPWNAAWDAEVQSEVADALTAYDPPTRAELTTDVNSILAKLLAYVQLLARSDAAIATDNATELTAINADGGSGAGDFSNQTEALEAVRDHIGDGTNLTEAGGDGDHLTEAGGDGDHLTTLATAAALGTVDGNVDSILTDTGTTLPATLATIAGYLDTEIAAILADTDEMQGDLADGGRLDLLIDAIKAATDLLNSAQAEPTGVPAANETPLEKVGYLFAALRNQVDVTASAKTFYDDAGAALHEKALSDDGTTYSEAETGAPA